MNYQYSQHCTLLCNSWSVWRPKKLFYVLDYVYVLKSHSVRFQNVYCLRCHCTKINPMALMCVSPLSDW